MDEWMTLFCDITPPIVVIRYRRFGTTCEGTKNPTRIELHSVRAQISSTSGGSIKSHKVHCGLQIALTSEHYYYYYYYRPVSHPSLLATSSFAGLVNSFFHWHIFMYQQYNNNNNNNNNKKVTGTI